MITIFNRKELLITCDLQQINQVRERLLANRIAYSVKATYDGATARNRNAFFGSAGKKERFVIYVRKTEWEYAMHLLRNDKFWC